MSASYTFSPTTTTGGEDLKVVELRKMIADQDAEIQRLRKENQLLMLRLESKVLNIEALDLVRESMVQP